MKILIWFLCILGYSVITTAIRMNGTLLGAIPTMMLFGGTWWLAHALCKAWDRRGEESDCCDDGESPV